MDSGRQVFSLGKSECLTQSIEVQLCPNPIIVSQFFPKFLKSTSNFEKKYEFHSWFFSKIVVWLLKCVEISASERSWRVKMLKCPKHCWNLHRSCFVAFFLSIWKNFNSKNSSLVVSEILRLFLNVLTLGNKYSLSVKVSV